MALVEAQYIDIRCFTLSVSSNFDLYGKSVPWAVRFGWYWKGRLRVAYCVPETEGHAQGLPAHLPASKGCASPLRLVPFFLHQLGMCQGQALDLSGSSRFSSTGETTSPTGPGVVGEWSLGVSDLSEISEVFSPFPVERLGAVSTLMLNTFF